MAFVTFCFGSLVSIFLPMMCLAFHMRDSISAMCLSSLDARELFS
jgi:hypothetical protein